MKKQMLFKTKGMNKDLSVSAFNPEFAFENRNLRLSTNEGNTLMSWVNEKGTEKITLVEGKWNPTDEDATATVTSISGTPIGTAVINNILVLFTTKSNTDRIYKLKYNPEDKSTMLGMQLYKGNLSFSEFYPLETLVSYEAENIQKVYWVDGKNQPRVINICADVASKPATYFDFVPELQLNETVKVQKMLGASGMFAPGVIQYSFTYFNKNGQESNIFYTTPLNYISYADRGASPEDKVDNVFKITVENIDTNFDYLRIYSIQRTSINGTPIVKRLQDINIAELTGTTATYTDTGTNGDAVDPTELLYKGGESIIAKTMEQKDNTLFLGNIKLDRPQEPINSFASGEGVTLTDTYRGFYIKKASNITYTYANQLTAYKNIETVNNAVTLKNSIPCAGFKGGDYYRCGIQFQHKTGKWSMPIFIEDHHIEGMWGEIGVLQEDNTIFQVMLPIIQGTLSLSSSSKTALENAGYLKVRPVVVFPELFDRQIICQGVLNPTMYTTNHRDIDDLYAQSSWFFRANYDSDDSDYPNKTAAPVYTGPLPYTSKYIATEGIYTVFNPDDIGAIHANLRQVEIQGEFDWNDQYTVDRNCLTFHSPEIEFDEQLWTTSFKDFKADQIGYCQFDKTFSDIGIQTETPTIASSSIGFDHNTFEDGGTYGIMSGLFYEDYIVDDNVDNDFEKCSYEHAPARWLVYPWQKQGSLNNDVERPGGKGTASAILKKKIISNLRYAYSHHDSTWENSNKILNDIQLFSSEEDVITKINNNIYRGNIDTLLLPNDYDGVYFAFDNSTINSASSTSPTSFDSINWWKTFKTTPDPQDPGGEYGLFKWNYSNQWQQKDSYIGDRYPNLVMKKDGVRMKYKSTPHLVIECSEYSQFVWKKSNYNYALPLVEIYRTIDTSVIFGGNSVDALKANTWIPCGEPVKIGYDSRTGAATSNGSTKFYYDYGDTYFQRWDCLKTYAYTKEDINQVVEIGSFMLETHVNIDGRYDRNRGQQSNLNMSPENFNLLNPVYSQVDNFFSYKILDDSAYENNKFPNQITWSKTKENGADVDLWTNVTLASILELDGDKGEITSLQRFNNNLIAFQDTGISRIMYNDNVQIQSTEGVPIEVANSGKVQGKDYLSDTVGCSNKWSIVSTPAGLYFGDSKGKNLYLFNGQLTNVSDKFGMSTWVKHYFFSDDGDWDPTFHNGYPFVSYYDKQNQDVLFLNYYDCLAFSEKLGTFTSLYDYYNTSYFINLDNTGVWIKSDGITNLWKHQAGDYCRFFGENKPYWMTLVGNPEPQLDKIFTNLEFRACVVGDGELSQSTGKFTPTLPFDSLETWDEYQHGFTLLENKNGHSAMVHGGDNSALKRKFRIWRCDIPRDNYDFKTYPVKEEGETEVDYNARVAAYNLWLAGENDKGISRHSRRPMDRMRNPWIYLKLLKKAEVDEIVGEETVLHSLPKTEVHDIAMTYFG